MISYISGKIKRKSEECLVIEVNGIAYEVLIPKAVMNVLKNNTSSDENIELVTYQNFIFKAIGTYSFRSRAKGGCAGIKPAYFDNCRGN